MKAADGCVPRVVLVMLVLCPTWLSACSVDPVSVDNLTPAQIGEVLYCLDKKLDPIGYAPPRFGAHLFRVRYVRGIVDKAADAESELHLIVYGEGEKRAILYELYFDQDGQPSIYIGEMGTLKRVRGRMEPDEIWGGVGTYRQVRRLLRVVSSKPAVSIPDDQVTTGPRSCVFQR